MRNTPEGDAKTLREASQIIRDSIRTKSGRIDPRKHFHTLLVTAQLDRMAHDLTPRQPATAPSPLDMKMMGREDAERYAKVAP